MRFNGSQDQIDILREVAENLAEPVFLVDKAHNVWLYNRAFEALVGVRMSSRRYEVQPCHALLGLDICRDSCAMMRAVESGQNVRLAEISGTTADGERHTVHINVVPLTNEAGGSFGALVFLRDITAETRIHQKYKELVMRNAAVSLAGRIENGNLPDIVQLLAFLQKTGYLVLRNGDAQGEIAFERGQMVVITLSHVRGEKAFGRLLGWQEASFSFRPEAEIEVAERLGKSSDFMLMDAIREKDELSARAAELPQLDSKPEVVRIASLEEEQIPQLEWQLYELGLRGFTVEQMLEALVAPDAKIWMALLELRTRGILRW